MERGGRGGPPPPPCPARGAGLVSTGTGSVGDLAHRARLPQPAGDPSASSHLTPLQINPLTKQGGVPLPRLCRHRPWPHQRALVCSQESVKITVGMTLVSWLCRW